MTPEERELIADLFNRLAPLESAPRDPEAARTIREGLTRAPNAVYALVQSVLVQDEALKAADKHIADLEDELQAAQQHPQQKRGFLDNMRDSILGRDDSPASRGSVPSVGDRPMGAPGGSGGDRPDPWGQARQSPQYRDEGYGGGGYGGPQGGGGYGAPQGGAPMGGQYGAPGGGGGGSFLGTAAAVAAGAIGGGLLMGGIRSAMGGHAQGSGSPFGGTFDQLARGGGGSAAGGELSRDAGLNDIGRSGGSRFSQAEADRQQDADQDQDDEQDADQDQDDEQDAGDFDSDDSDTA